MRKKRNLYSLLLISLIFCACAKDKTYYEYKPVSKFNETIYQYLSEQPGVFDSVLFVLDKSGLSALLKGQDEYTFFAPTDRSLEATMAALNIYRSSSGLEPISLKDIDASSWRAIMGNYIIKGRWKVQDFTGQDGARVTTVASRWMYGKLTSVSASGAADVGGRTLTYSYNNGSRFTKDWLPALVTTSQISLTNGEIHILEAGHNVGYNYFIEKTSAIQNMYSEERAFSTGNAYLPNFQISSWANRVKKLVPRGENAVETEAADQGGKDLFMLLTVRQNDSIDIVQGADVTSGIIEKNGPCYFDRENLAFVLNYKYKTTGAFVPVNESITYTAN